MAAQSDHAAAQIVEDLWMVRPCRTYLEEYNECKTFKSRFHQQYIYGETLPCEQWKKDFDNCVAHKEKKSHEALSDLLESERNRRRKRLAAAGANDVWEYRQTPPSDWNKPLPEHLDRNRLPTIETNEKPSRCSIS